MTNRATGDGDPFRVWLEASRSLLPAAPTSDPTSDTLRERCTALFGAWARFAETYAKAAGAGDAAAGGGGDDRPAAPGATGGPFDPLAWLDAASGGGFGDLWRWFGSGQGGWPGGWQDGWKAERDAILASREWGSYALALGRYQAAMAEGWLAAFRRFSDELARDHAGAEPPSWETIRARWQETADRELAKAMRSEAFLAAQRDLIRARLDCAVLIRRRLEGVAEIFGLPTRAEVDDLSERIHALSREVRALKTAGTTKAPAKTAAKGTAKATGRRTGQATAKPAARETSKATGTATSKATAKATPKGTSKATVKATAKRTAKRPAGKASGRKAAP